MQEKCQGAFKKVKAMLMLKPVLCTPNFQKWFKLAMDASDIGARAIVLQEDVNEVEHPIYYFSKKFQKGQKNYCNSERIVCLGASPKTH